MSPRFSTPDVIHLKHESRPYFITKLFPTNQAQQKAYNAQRHCLTPHLMALFMEWWYKSEWSSDVMRTFLCSARAKRSFRRIDIYIYYAHFLFPPIMLHCDAQETGHACMSFLIDWLPSVSQHSVNVFYRIIIHGQNPTPSQKYSTRVWYSIRFNPNLRV